MGEHAVVIVGAGPTGMMLAAELALAGVDVAVVEMRAAVDRESSRAGGLQSRTLEVLDQRGVADRFVAQGQTAQVASFGGVPLDISDFPTRHNYGLALWQRYAEHILADWVEELGVPLQRERAFVGFTKDGSGVDVTLSSGPPLRAEYLVGCDGGRSAVRKAAGIEFPGWDPVTSYLLGEVEIDGELEFGVRRDDKGVHAVASLGDGVVGVVVREEEVGRSGTPTLEDLRDALVDARGTHYGTRSARWVSRFTDATRQAASYRDGRVLLAGDAAHIHAPLGGQGLNLGVQDAVNLGWKLAQVVTGFSPETLLDTYQSERQPVAARVMQNTLAQTVLTRGNPRVDALRDFLSQVLSMDEPRKHMAAMISGLDIHYELGDGHPLLGRRMPDIDLMTADGPTHVFALLHDAKPMLLNLGAPGALDITSSVGRVRSIDATYDGAWELPVLGVVSAPSAVLVRPDGYVAWVGDGTDAGVAGALTKWCGAPSSVVAA
ncbi:MAG: FAD-dependent oxidoreductase [Candidatus Dormibacteria bacterium]